MKVSKSNKTAVTFTNELYTNCYISSWSKSMEVTLMDYEVDGTEHKFEFTMTIDKARSLAKELAEDIANYDEELAKKAEQEAEEAVDG